MTPATLARIRAVRRAQQVLRSGSFPVTAVIDRVVLDADERFRRRIVLKGEAGLTFLLDFAEVTALHDGDGIVMDDGTIVAVVAKTEALVEIAAGRDAGAGSAAPAARLAWHLGNRHAEVEIVGDRLRMRRDHVLEEMLRGLGAVMTPLEAPFEPERGAYRHGHSGDDRTVV